MFVIVWLKLTTLLENRLLLNKPIFVLRPTSFKKFQEWADEKKWKCVLFFSYVNDASLRKNIHVMPEGWYCLFIRALKISTWNQVSLVDW